MNFTKWINNKGTKCIITNRVSNGNSLIRKYNIYNRKDTKEVTCKSVRQIAEELFLAWTSFENGYKEVTFLNSSACVFILNTLLEKGKYSFIPKESLCIRTSEEILRALNQLRMNVLTEDFVNSREQKVLDLKSLWQAYEKELRMQEALDEPMLLAECLKILEQISEGRKYPLSMYLPWVRDCSLGILEDFEPTAKESAFLDRLTALSGMQTDRLEMSAEREAKVSYQFFSAYGAVNEVRHVAQKIEEAKLSYGDVTVFYTAPEYEQYIKAVFGGRRIPCNFVSGQSLASVNVLRFMTSIIDFIKEDYLYESLSAAVDNPAMTFKALMNKDEEAKGKKNPRSCYDYFLKKGIGWGKNRFFDCIFSVEQNEGECAEYQYFLQFLKDLLQIEEENISCGALYQNLLAFTRKYTHFGQWENQCVLPVLKEQQLSMDRMQRTEDFKETLQLVKDQLTGLTIKEGSEPYAVNIVRVQNVEVLERAYNFIIGMTAKQFNADMTESPVLSDAQLRRYIQEHTGHPILAKDAAKRLHSNLNRTLRTLEEGTVIMGYSTFDTVELKEASPSGCYLDYLELSNGKIQRIGNQPFDIEQGNIKIFDEAILEKLKNNKKDEADADNLKSEDVLVVMSPTALQTLVQCPLKYCYQSVLYLPAREFQKKEASCWLDTAKKGNLFHGVMEEYCNRMLQGREILTSEADDQVFDEIYGQEIVKMKAVWPYVSEIVAVRETEENKKIAWKYVQNLQAQFWEEQQGERKWRVLGSELHFSDIIYKVKGEKEEDAVFSIAFRGSIDRLDGYVDGQGKLKLRIVDYKTGDFKKKEREIQEEHQLQHYVYAMAALEYAEKEKASLESIFGAEITGVDIEHAQYVFPYETADKQVLETCGEVKAYICGEERKLPKSVDAVLWKTIRYFQRGQKPYLQQDLQKVEEVLGSALPGGDACQYCNYKKQCIRKIGTEM